MTPAQEESQPFIAYLENLVRRQARGALAQLRRGLGKPPGLALEMHRHVVPFLPRERPWEEDVYYLVAALFAFWHQGVDTVATDPPKNLGASLACLVDQANADSLERRFLALLKSHEDDLPHHLRQIVALLKGKGIPLDWRQLWQDLKQWGHPDRFVQQNWARAFWGRSAAASPSQANEPQTTTEEIPT